MSSLLVTIKILLEMNEMGSIIEIVFFNLKLKHHGVLDQDEVAKCHQGPSAISEEGA
jgi:hypothetical protein